MGGLHFCGEGSDTGTPGEQIGGGKVSVSDLNLMFTGGKLSARASFVILAPCAVEDE